ncbi:hypothetical protein F5888DRAFT_1806201 [Russula emetica]|nr:hypothetical protein F5888DRAFT_1806201 [Russula emetica]
MEKVVMRLLSSRSPKRWEVFALGAQRRRNDEKVTGLNVDVFAIPLAPSQHTFRTLITSLFSTKIPRAIHAVQIADVTRCTWDGHLPRRVGFVQREACRGCFAALTVEQIYQGVDYGKRGVDFTIALPRFRLPGKVDVLAKTVIDQVFQADDLAESITHDKVFLHFLLKTPSLVRAVLTQVHELTYDAPSGKPEYGTNTSESGAGKKVVIEYSSPNIAKSFHLGLIAVGFEKYGSEEELQKDAIKHLFDVYVNINKDAESDPGVKAAAAAWFKRMEDGDEDALKN